MIIVIIAVIAFLIMLRPLVEMAMKSWLGLFKAMLIGGGVFLALGIMAVASR